MPTFDVVSEVDMQEVRNAVDQAHRELATRFDFKGTDSTVELDDKTGGISLGSASEERIKAVAQVLEEKLVRRKVSLKVLEYGKIEEAAKGAVRQNVKLTVGISDEKAKEIARFLKASAPKGVSHQIQGKELRVQGKKRDDLQSTIQLLREHDFEIPLEFKNFRD